MHMMKKKKNANAVNILYNHTAKALLPEKLLYVFSACYPSLTR